MDRAEVRITVNGTPRSAAVDVRRTLVDFLRDDLRLTGTHVGCEHGVCGACTVLVDGRAVRSCLMLAVQADGASVRTIEGLALDGELGPIQAAMRDGHAFQCGFCTPGFLMTIAAILDEGAPADEASWRAELSANLCRCTGYQSIVDAAMEAARRVARGTEAS